MILTEKQKQIIDFMQKNKIVGFKHLNAIELFKWSDTYPYKTDLKTRLPFFSIMNKLEKKGIVKRNLELIKWGNYSDVRDNGYFLTDYGKQIKILNNENKKCKPKNG